MMRILQLVPSLELGGLEVMVARLSEALDAAGFEVHLGELTRPGVLAQSDIWRSRWVGNLRLSRGMWDARCHLGLLRLLVRNRFSLVHVHNVKSCAYLLPASVLSRTPVVYTVHGRGLGQYQYERGMRRVNRLGSGVIRRYVAVSQDVKDRLMRVDGVSASKILLIRNGIDVNSSQAQTCMSVEEKRLERERMGIAGDSFVVGSIGRFSAEKNYPLLVRAFARLLQQVSGFPPSSRLSARSGLRRTGGFQPSASAHSAHSHTPTPPYSHTPILLLVGDGPARAEIERAVAECGIKDRVLMPGAQSDVLPWFRALDVFCLSSRTEGCSMSLLEACACGLPAVVTDVGGNREIIEDGVSGLVVPEGDEQALSDAIGHLASDEGLRRRMGASGRRVVEAKYSLEQMVRSYERLYEAVAGRDREKP